MREIALTGLARIAFPTGTVRLCDGGFITFRGETYRGSDPVFGTIGAMEQLTEGVGNEVPALGLTFLPAANAAPGDLSQPGFQTARAQFWVVEYDVATNAPLTDPDPLFDGQVDRTELVVGRGRRVECTVVSMLERLFELNIGNSLSAGFHKSVWPGELGHDNATGVGRPVAWGAASPAGGGSSSGPPAHRRFRNYRETYR